MSPAAEPDYWAVLGLEPGADSTSLKRAFRAQARRWHPDLNGNDPVAEERFKLVNEAYAVLSDPRRRQAWEAGDPDAAGATAEAEPADPFASGFPDFDDYLQVLFGRSDAARSNADDRHGASAPGSVQGQGPSRSQGRGFQATRSQATRSQAVSSESGGPAAARSEVGVSPAPPPPPPVSAGSDLETLVELTPEQALQGARVELSLPDGTVVEVWTPPLAGDGWRLRLEGLAPGGGDHFLQLRVRTEEGLRVDGLRVLYTLELTPPQAVLGCAMAVPTLDGPVRLRVPPGSSSGRLLRLRDRGLHWGGHCGDQLVELRIVVPEDLGDAELALYRRLQELADGET